MNRSLRIAVADDEQDTLDFFQDLLPRLGHEVVALAQNGRQLIEQCRTTSPDLIVTDIKMPDLDGIAAAAEVNRVRPVPTILLSAYHDVDLRGRAGTEHIMSYLVKPVKAADLAVAIALAMMRFEHFLRLSQETTGLRQALEDRKIIERAKGIVMKQGGVGEGVAFERLEHLANTQGLRLIEVARTVVTAAEAFRPPDPGRPAGTSFPASGRRSHGSGRGQRQPGKGPVNTPSTNVAPDNPLPGEGKQPNP